MRCVPRSNYSCSRASWLELACCREKQIPTTNLQPKKDRHMKPKRKRGYRNWLDLPEDITASIFSRLRATFILDNCQFVCKTWLKICKANPLVWRTIHLQRRPHDDYIYGSMEHMCRDLIDRSRGCLVDISLTGFGTDMLLKHIADTSSCGIRRLRLEDCPEITEEGFCRVASNFQQLQELDISACCFLSCKTLELIGRSCPHLVTLKLKRQYNRGSKSMFGYSIVSMARTMPGLQSLWLSGFMLTKDEIDKISESCLALETLVYSIN